MFLHNVWHTFMVVVLNVVLLSIKCHLFLMVAIFHVQHDSVRGVQVVLGALNVVPNIKCLLFY
jgi:hypothetical protein